MLKPLYTTVVLTWIVRYLIKLMYRIYVNDQNFFIVSLVYGSCIPSNSCIATACNDVIPQSLHQGMDISLRDCNFHCCDGDFCNAVPSPHTIAPTPSGLLSMLSFIIINTFTTLCYILVGVTSAPKPRLDETTNGKYL